MNPAALPSGEPDPDNATRQVPESEVAVPLNKTTTRALAASIAFVAAGTTVAGVAVFHLPVLGFGRAAAASAATAPVRSGHTVIRKVAPIKVVRTRYVDDIVHRPAPTSAYPMMRAVAATSAPRPAAPVAPVVAVALSVPSPATAVAASQSSPRATYHEDSAPDRERSNHNPPAVHGSTSLTANPAGADQ